MACCGFYTWMAFALPLLILLFSIQPDSATSARNDYITKDLNEVTLPESTLRHIMQLVTIGTGLHVPTPLSLRFREKSLKRARLSAPSRSEIVIGSEFLGKRAANSVTDFMGKRMGSEFLGKRVASESIGGPTHSGLPLKRMGSEFLGKRVGSEFLGKRVGSEFLGKRVGSEFPGKRMGSEFPGKRMGSEFLGKRSGPSPRDKRMRSEFVGKRDASSDFLSKDPDGELGQRMRLEFLGKRMGSEFLGRKRRETTAAKAKVEA